MSTIDQTQSVREGLVGTSKKNTKSMQVLGKGSEILGRDTQQHSKLDKIRGQTQQVMSKLGHDLNTNIQMIKHLGHKPSQPDPRSLSTRAQPKKIVSQAQLQPKPTSITEPYPFVI